MSLKTSSRRALLIVAMACSLAVILWPNFCDGVPAWLRWWLGCPECDGSEAGNAAAGGGCSGASELRLPAGFEIEGGGRGGLQVGKFARR